MNASIAAQDDTPGLFLRLLTVEGWKARRYHIVALCVLAPVLFVALRYSALLRLYDLAQARGFDLGRVMVNQLASSWASVGIPLAAFVLSLLTASWEHAGNAYRLWFSHGVRRAPFFAAKLAFLYVLLAITTISVGLSVSLAAVTADFARPGFLEAVPLLDLWRKLLAAYAASGGLLALHFWAAASGRGVGRPLSIGLLALFVALLLATEAEGPWNLFYPWLMPGEAVGRNMLPATAIGVVASIGLSAAVIRLLSAQRVL